MKDKFKFLIALVVLLIGGIFISGNFSVIGQYENDQSCLFNEVDGGLCEVELTLPEYRSLNSYNLDLSFEEFPSPIKYGEQTLSPFTHGGDYYEEDEEEEPTQEEELEHNWVYLYRIPSEWNDFGVLNLEAIAYDGYLKTTHYNADGDIRINTGYLAYPYTQTSMKVCNQERSSNCGLMETRLLRWYRDDRYGEQKFQLYNDISVDLLNYSSMSVGGSSDMNIEFREDVFKEGEIIVENIPTLDSFTNLKSEMAMFVHVQVGEDWKGDVDWSIQMPPVLTMSYKKLFYPTDVEYKIEGVSVIHNLVGEQSLNTTSDDLSQDILDYCERNFGNEDSCTLKLIFDSQTTGIMNINAENAQLKVISGKLVEQEEPVYEEESFITGLITKYNDYHEENGYVTSIAVLLILFTSITSFIVWRKRK